MRRFIRWMVGLVGAGALIAGCAGQQAPGTAPALTPMERCALAQSLASGAETGLLLAKIKDATARAALYAAVDGVKAASADYCDALDRGNPQATASLLAGFRATLDSFNAQLRAQVQRELEAPAPSTSKAPAPLAFGGGREGLAGAWPGARAGLAGGSSGA